MRIEPEISGMSVVAVGDFSPAVFTPAWFALYNLLPRNAVDSSNVQIVSSEVTAFSYEWLRVEATRNHLIITTLQEPYVRLRDVVIRMFREQFSNAPVNALGINRTVHFRVRNFDERNRIGRALAPVDAWGIWGHDLERDSSRGGMTSLTMTQTNIEERSKDDRVNVQVEPSNRVGGGCREST